jgi:glycosyltransferase involved in cell wall biosynthesis
MKKVLWLTNIPSPYRVDFFNLLGKFVKLNVVFERKKSTERKNEWYRDNLENFHYVFLKGLKFRSDRAISISVIRHLSKNYDFIVISNPMTPTGIIATSYLKIRRISFIIEGDGGFPKYNESVVKKILKREALKKASWYFSSGPSHSKYYEYYGVNKSKLLSYHFSSNYKSEILTTPPSINEKIVYRRKYNIKNKKIILFVGQFVYRKGLDILFKALREVTLNYILLLVGDTVHTFNQLELNTTNVNYKIIGFKSKENLKQYYDMSDFLILPTREDIWGLVINEAFARGLPVISTKRCGAAIELVEDAINGYVVDTENSDQLLNKIEIMLSNDLREMSRKALAKVRHYSIEKMVEDHIILFDKITKEKHLQRF